MTFRRLPDGTVLDEQTGMVSAPRLDLPRMSATAGPTVARTQVDPSMGALPGLAGNYNMPGQWPMHMRDGRNYPALGTDAPVGLTTSQRVLAIAAILGATAVTVWLQRKRKKA